MYAIAELPRGQPGDRVDHIPRNLTQRMEHEEPFAKARMRDLEIPFLYDFIPRKNQVQIERPGRTLIRPRATRLRLNRAQCVEDLTDRPIRLTYADSVQIRRIVLEPRPDRCSFDD